MSAKARDDDSSPSEPSLGRSASRASDVRIAQVLKLAFVLLGLLLGGFAVAAWFGGEPDYLPFEYEGFD